MGLDWAAGRVDGWTVRNVRLPAAVFLDRLGVRANHLSAANLVGCLVAAVIAQQHTFAAAGILFFFASSLDAFDGSLGYVQAKTTNHRLRVWFDAVADKAGESAMYVGLLFASSDVGFLRLVALALLSTVFVSLSKALAGEFGIKASWEEVRALGRGLRITVVSLGLVGAGLSGLPLEVAMGPTLAILIVAVNLPLLAHRLRKTVLAARR